MANVTIYLDPGCFVPHATLIPELVDIAGTNYPVFGWAFTPAAANFEQLTCRWLATNYGASNPNVSVLFDWYSRAGSTTGTVSWGAALSVLTPGDAQPVETDAFATENTQAGTVNGTARGLVRTTVTISNLDSLTADDTVAMRIRRVDTTGIAGDAVLIGVTVRYVDT